MYACVLYKINKVLLEMYILKPVGEKVALLMCWSTLIPMASFLPFLVEITKCYFMTHWICGCTSGCGSNRCSCFWNLVMFRCRGCRNIHNFPQPTVVQDLEDKDEDCDNSDDDVPPKHSKLFRWWTRLRLSCLVVYCFASVWFHDHTTV